MWSYPKKIYKKIYFKKKYNISIKLNMNISLNTELSRGVYMENNTTIFNAKIGYFTYIGGFSRVINATIGNYSSIGPDVLIGENEHILSNFTTCNYLLSEKDKIEYNELNSKNTLIENDVWIGARAFIKKGVTISNGAVVAAHAVVTKNVPPYAIVAGIPAKVIGYRFDEDIIEQLLKSEWFLKEREDIYAFLNTLPKSYTIKDFLYQVGDL